MKRKIKEIWEKTVGLVTALAVLAFFVLVIVACIVGIMRLVQSVRLRPADDLPPAEPAEGVAWIMPEARQAALWLSPVCGDDAETARMLDEYTEGDAPVPAWWNPDEEMAVEWTDNAQKYDAQSDSVDYIAHPPVGIDQGGVDWNVCTTVWGWDGHGMEVWEMDLFSRITYLEFYGCSQTCIEAGIDSILLLWDMGEYGRTMGELLSAQYAPGYYVYSPYAYVWDWDYDAEGLADIRAMCEERFVNGPTWCAPYFRLWYYHEWAVPAYEIDGVYFSTGKGW